MPFIFNTHLTQDLCFPPTELLFGSGTRFPLCAAKERKKRELVFFSRPALSPFFGFVCLRAPALLCIALASANKARSPIFVESVIEPQIRVIISLQNLPICLCLFLSKIFGSRFILYYCSEKLISFVIGKYQRHYIKGLCKRMWMTTGKQTVFFQGPHYRVNRIVNWFDLCKSQ